MRSPHTRPLLFLLAATACGSDPLCVPPPCAPPFAVSVTVTASGVTGAVPGAFVTYPNATTPVLCSQSPGSTCFLSGGGGTYELDIGAPGYATVHRSVVVTSTTPACGCESVNLQHVDVVLAR